MHQNEDFTGNGVRSLREKAPPATDGSTNDTTGPQPGATSADEALTITESRCWQLRARLDGVLDTACDRSSRLQYLADLIAAEFADGALLTAPRAAAPGTVTVAAHRDPGRRSLLQRAAAEVGDVDLRSVEDWLASHGGPAAALRRDDVPAQLLPFYRRYADEFGIADAVLATLSVRGRPVGLLVCARDAGSPGFDSRDVALVRAAAARVGLLLEVINLGAERRRSHQWWDIAFAGSPAGMCTIDSVGRVSAVNPAGVAILGKPAEEIIGTPAAQLLPLDDANALLPDALLPDAVDALRSDGLRPDALRPGGADAGRGGVRTFRVVDAAGEVRWWRVATTPIPDTEDSTTACVVQFSDVSEWLRAEERAAVFESLVRSSPDFIAITALDGRLTFVNDAGRRLVGLPEDVDLGTLRSTQLWSTDMKTVPGSERTGPGWWQGVSTLRPWDGSSEIPVQATTFVVPDPATGRPMAVATKRRDFRDELASRRRVEALSEQRRELLRDLVDTEHNERRRLAEDLHDEPVQLVAAAQLRLQLLLLQYESGDTEGSRESARSLDALLGHAQRSLRRIMTEIEPADDAAGDMAAGLREAADLLFAGSSTTVLVEGQVSGLPADAAAALQRSAREALSNARKHSEASTVRVLLSDGELVSSVVVVDDGIGIGDGLPQREGHLGVRIITNRIQALGGEVTFRSRPGGGTVVTLTVPRPDDASGVRAD